MSPFKALRIHAEVTEPPGISSMQADELTAGEVLVKVEYSSLNYKDALAVTGKGKILRKFPLNAGIDVAGEVVASDDDHFKPGDKIVATGCGLGESRDGGYAEYCKVPSAAAVKIPSTWTTRAAMALGTAGFTAGLCYERMLMNDQSPEKGPILVTGASGGVGSIATLLFSRKEYEVWAVSGKTERYQALEDLGAARTVAPDEFSQPSRPLQKAIFGGVVDNVGGELLAQAVASVKLWGNVACVGLAQSPELHTTVMPMILRGVSLLGISSANCPRPLREKVWETLADTLTIDDLNALITQEVSLDEVYDVSTQMIQRQTSGRYIVKI